VRLVHIADRLTDRGGAYWHLLGVLEELSRTHDLLLAVGAAEGAVEAPCPLRVIRGLASRTRAPVDLAPLVRDFGPDIVHLHNVMNPEVLDWAAEGPIGGRGWPVPALLTVQDHRYFCPSRGKWTRAGAVCQETAGAEVCVACFEDEAYFQGILALTQERLRAARRLPLVVLSLYMKKELAAAGVPEARISVIPPFVHGLPARGAPEGPPCVLFVGRLVEAKGARDAVAAWRRSGLELPLVFAGTGPLREELEGLPGVEVRGWVPHARLAALYRRARAVLMPSRWQEPFGIVGLEALHFGVPVVTYESGGIREWHPGLGLVAWGDLEALADALREAVGRRAEAPRGFERERLMEELVGLYGALAQSPLGR
jgi:glycosyltransferase involved in cell wall biosynthesis